MSDVQPKPRALDVETSPTTPRPDDLSTPGAGLDPTRMPGHWLLARMGKRVLRPGGRQLTRVLLDALDVTPADRVVELAPGLGATTRLVLDRRPDTYTGIERDERAAERVRGVLGEGPHRCQVGSALHTGLDDASATVVFGEAFLSMQSDDHKPRIVQEAFRILRPGGRYGLHELAIRPDTVADEVTDDIRLALSHSLHVGARPVTVAGWRALLENAGFEVTRQETAPMALLERRRVLADEGLAQSLRIGRNILRDRDARQRVLSMRATFRRHADHLVAVALVARKPGEAAP